MTTEHADLVPDRASLDHRIRAPQNPRQALPSKRIHLGPWLRIGINVLYAAALMVVGLLPNPTAPTISLPDWLAHAVAYGGQTVILYWMFRLALDRRTSLLAAWAVTVPYGAVVETLQLAQAARTFEIADLVANTCGAGVAGAIVVLGGRFFRRPYGSSA